MRTRYLKPPGWELDFGGQAKPGRILIPPPERRPPGWWCQNTLCPVFGDS
ncbi:MAG: hypothetical protein WCQ21_05555 [Verrucomicrobiota bacterium]